MTTVDQIVERVRDLLLQRSQKGLQCYGIGLDRTDLTMAEWLQHLQDELLDGANYVEALKIHAVDSMAILRSANANLRGDLARAQAENVGLRASFARMVTLYESEQDEAEPFRPEWVREAMLHNTGDNPRA